MKRLIALLFLCCSCEGIKFQGDLDNERYELRQQRKIQELKATPTNL